MAKRKPKFTGAVLRVEFPNGETEDFKLRPVNFGAMSDTDKDVPITDLVIGGDELDISEVPFVRNAILAYLRGDAEPGEASPPSNTD